MKNQTIFNKVAKHLLKQGVRSESNPGNCRYKGPNGLKCAVGALIPNKVYSENFEGLTVLCLRKNGEYFTEEDGYSESNIALLWALQFIHDDLPCDDWKLYLSKLATEFELKGLK